MHDVSGCHDNSVMLRYLEHPVTRVCLCSVVFLTTALLHLAKKIPTFYGTRRYITLFTSGSHSFSPTPDKITSRLISSTRCPVPHVSRDTVLRRPWRPFK